MPLPHDVALLHRATVGPLGPLPWFDAHTHIGQNDPDGVTATAEEILTGLDEAGQERALTFAMHEPNGYREANDVVLAASAASDGRLLPLARIAPGSPGALDEARRCLDAGALGFKLHPRSDAFALTHPDVEAVVALAAERRAPVLFHAGRGIPQLGAAAVGLAERHPDARLILAHAAVSDLGVLAEPATRLPNLYFDTSWWHPSDVLQLFATIPPARILYASDMPYGPGAFSAFAVARSAAAVGLEGDALRSIAGAQLDRVVRGEDPIELGPAPGIAALGPRFLQGERVASYVAIALQLAFHGQDATEALSLARSGAQATDTGEAGALLRVVDGLLERTQAAVAAAPPGEGMDGLLALFGALGAAFLAATPSAGIPDLDA
ncbi:amidohydrolase family protein [Patulibacter americanus]|uniref:amidohydrolase family protein n=1 Tax=Patulibacter americanus TaxID=588672 RepID=UPI0003B4ABAD|nr:amidohydrolase family protein [Patulibacter americanus]